MHDTKRLLEEVENLRLRIPLGVLEQTRELDFCPSHWFNIRMGNQPLSPKTIRKLKAFIEKYKDVV
jgi:hypothetical protein